MFKIHDVINHDKVFNARYKEFIMNAARSTVH